jgi:hypothetical protein
MLFLNYDKVDKTTKCHDPYNHTITHTSVCKTLFYVVFSMRIVSYLIRLILVYSLWCKFTKTEYGQLMHSSSDFMHPFQRTMAYLLYARTVEAHKQPLLNNTRTQQ